MVNHSSIMIKKIVLIGMIHLTIEKSQITKNKGVNPKTRDLIQIPPTLIGINFNQNKN